MKRADMVRIQRLVGREPWLAAGLSWLLPGSAHVLSGAYAWGMVFICAFVTIEAAYIVSLISEYVPAIWTIVLHVCSLTVLAVLASVSALHRIRGYAVSCSQMSPRSASKDVYFVVFLTLLLPGIGHAYMRKWLGAIVLVFTYMALRVVLPAGIYSLVNATVLRMLAVMYAFAVYPHGDTQHTRTMKIPVVLLIGACLAGCYLIPLVEGLFFVSVVRTSGESMEPTIPAGSYVVVDRFSYICREPAIGDMVLIRLPKRLSDENSILQCKRIVAIGGEAIQVQKGIAFVDGQVRQVGPSLNVDSSPTRLPPERASSVYYGVNSVYHVPLDHYFILGDNRANSHDSRYYGAIPRDCVIGRVAKTLRAQATSE